MGSKDKVGGYHVVDAPPDIVSERRRSGVRERNEFSREVVAALDELRDLDRATRLDRSRVLASSGLFPLDELLPLFPGELITDPRIARRGQSVSVAADLLIAHGEAAVPYVAQLLTNHERDVRIAAATVASELASRGLLESLIRLALHSCVSSRAAAHRALSSFRAAAIFDDILRAFRETACDRNAHRPWRLASLEAIMSLRDSAAVAPLVELLADRDRRVARTAHTALRLLTGHDFGNLRVSWQGWLSANQLKPRYEWLLDGMSDRRAAIRRTAAEELAHVVDRPDLVLDVTADEEQFLRLQRYYRTFFRGPSA